MCEVSHSVFNHLGRSFHLLSADFTTSLLNLVNQPHTLLLQPVDSDAWVSRVSRVVIGVNISREQYP